MPVTSVTRWKIDHEEAKKLASEAAPRLKMHGASGVRIGYCHSGAFTNQTMVIVIYPDWETYGKAVQAQSHDMAYQHILGQALSAGELQERMVMVTHDL
jgi:hypothetical protein